jgi:DnaD/phage-associated family protein
MANTLTFRPSKQNSELLTQLLELAKQDNRKLNNYIEIILLNWIKDNPLNVVKKSGGKKN